MRRILVYAAWITAVFPLIRSVSAAPGPAAGPAMPRPSALPRPPGSNARVARQRGDWFARPSDPTPRVASTPGCLAESRIASTAFAAGCLWE